MLELQAPPVLVYVDALTQPGQAMTTMPLQTTCYLNWGPGQLRQELAVSVYNKADLTLDPTINNVHKVTSARGLQLAAAAMVRESRGACSNLTRKIARAGTHGKHGQNIERDITRALGLVLHACSN